ncbi:ATP-binding protein [Paenibacillus allorhizosphaerae]|uniref:histidine kinase n=1 Tax=Paenibacillus allorhizosphaerae TaxID=2849866 RepID=A0ABN7TR22_9BACL|nr:ATP-binding protein [Paenibacillus allorhizosphaerae]CAG7644223.1 Adaptive-response sensory-kinase SasA [Paenibacillus allorhizosphaerae]
MDTKSKNKRYPALIWGLAIILLLVGLLSVWDVIRNRAYLQSDYYFQSEPFTSQLTVEWDLLQYYHIDLKNYPEWGPAAKTNTEYIRKLRSSYESMIREKEQEIRRSYEANGAYAPVDGTAPPQPQTGEMNQQIGKAAAQLNAQLQRDISEHIAFLENQYKDVKRNVERRDGIFGYFIKNKGTGQIYTNLSGEPDQGWLKDMALYWHAFPSAPGEAENLLSISQYFKQNRLEGTILVYKEPREFSQIHADYRYYLSIRERLLKECVLAGAALLMAALALYGTRKFRIGLPQWIESIIVPYRRVPLDIRALILLAVVYLFFVFADLASVFKLPFRFDAVFPWFFLCLCTAFILVQIKETLFLFRTKGELRRQWETSYSRKLKVLITQILDNRGLFFKSAALFALTAVLGVTAVILPIAFDDGLDAAVLLCTAYIAFYLFAVLPYVLKRVAAFNTIVAGSEAIAAGRFETTVKPAGKGNLYRLAQQLNSMKDGFQTSLQNQMKSERLKTELITNVSHDLKTPLTSIISYVDLLKKNDITEAEREAYIAVLDRKTQRLKALIDDLFEASKMASGAAELNLETVNVASLLNQAMAEFSERIEASSCRFKVSIPEHKVPARLDGKKIWRVFENLIGNALKYAMPNTRVYVSLTENEHQVMFTIKNVSAYEIEFEVDELLERFKRGDQSRHTEGSGLGLAIAKSIVDLHGGELRIEIDGDYFKVTVTLDKNLEPMATAEGN